MLSNKRRAIVFAVLIILVFGASLYKIARVKNNSHFDPSSPGSLYISESAFQYRYAEIVAKNGKKALDILRHDTAVQYPDTINVFKYETPMMELFYGSLYRLCGFGLTFNLFLIYATCLVSSLAIIGVFIITRRLSGDDIIALTAAVFYAATPAA